MTEADWMESSDVVFMLEYLKPDGRERKTWLLKCAYCRDAWHLLSDSDSRHAIEVAERIADGSVTTQELNNALREANRAVGRASYQGGGIHDAAYPAHTAAHAAYCTASNSELFAVGIARAVCIALASAAGVTGRHQRYSRESKGNYDAAQIHARAELAKLTRCVVGNPLRPVTLDPFWLTSTVTALATGIYEQRAFDRLPILADALQEAGCENEDVLSHCRGEGPHARGCWVIDLILGKQ